MKKLLILIVILVGAYFATQYFYPEFLNKYLKTSPQNSQAPQVPVSNETAKPTKDETANWKTYRNEKYGFEVKIPRDLNIDEISESPSILFTSPKLREKLKSYQLTPYDIIFYQSDYKVDEFKSPKIFNIKLGATTWEEDPLFTIMDPSVNFRVSKGNKNYNFSIFSSFNQEIIKLILSTFKFIP